MRSHISALLACTASLLMAGCNSLGGVPEFVSAGIAPVTLHPGDTALITVQVKDKNDIVAAVRGVIQEEPSRPLNLHDDGQEGDIRAGDGIWSLAVQVPLQAPAGTFNLTFTAYRSDGVPVPIRGADGTIESLAVHMPLVISLKE